MRVLDLFCCGGGAARGMFYHAESVLGIDINDMSKYYPYDFIQWDVLTLKVDWIKNNFDFVWASPPCQRFSVQTKQNKTQDNHPDLVDPTRKMLDETGLPYCMENVMGAPLRRDLMLCGKMFNLDVARHRIFECSGFTPKQPEHVPHTGRVITVTGNPGGSSKRDGSKHYGSTAEWREAMGIDWLPARLLKEAIPPAYSEYILGEFINPS